MRTVIWALVVCLGLQCSLSSRAAAQVGGNCKAEINNAIFGGWAGPTQGLFDCSIEGSYLVNCWIFLYTCAPPDAAGETCAACAAARASHPISLASGNTYIEQTDVRLPGLSGGLTLKRTWNSLWPATQTALQVGLFGPNWRSNFEERIFSGSDNYLKYARGDGTFWSFGWGSPSGGAVWSVAAPANASATLTEGPSYSTITFQNGEQRLFSNTSGNLIAIIDRNGNTTQLTYDAVGRLVTVTDPVSRHLYFSYANGSSLLVTGVTSDAGPSLTYTYNTQGLLTQVTEPDLSTLSFQYNSQSLITAVTDSNGKILESHTYDSSGRGLTGSQANGVSAVTLTYSN
jgi:YD repeat-containing protein